MSRGMIMVIVVITFSVLCLAYDIIRSYAYYHKLHRWYRRKRYVIRAYGGRDNALITDGYHFHYWRESSARLQCGTLNLRSIGSTLNLRSSRIHYRVLPAATWHDHPKFLPPDTTPGQLKMWDRQHRIYEQWP